MTTSAVQFLTTEQLESKTLRELLGEELAVTLGRENVKNSTGLSRWPEMAKIHTGKQPNKTLSGLDEV